MKLSPEQLHDLTMLYLDKTTSPIDTETKRNPSSAQMLLSNYKRVYAELSELVERQEKTTL